jgi:glycine/D-amino acid oxidase-like deaminating enzyme/nitrite reductase/ring-hydroxylating ferredoxin subunit
LADDRTQSGDRTGLAHAALPDATEPLWISTEPGRPFPRLERDLEVDVAIVGGGITALTAATLLARAGRRVAVLEARRIARGESGHTTAHLTAYPDAGLSKLIQRFGAEQAAEVWRAGLHAIRHVEQGVAASGIDCAFRRVPGFRYTERESGLGELDQELEAARRVGAAVRRVEDDVPMPRARAALRFDDQAQFHPRRYLLALAEALPGRGSEVFEETRAIEVEDDESAPTVTTEHGRVRARDVIVAANVPVNNRVWLQTKIAHYRTYAIAARLATSVPRELEALFWDDHDPYHYVRTHREAGSTLLIVGGEDHRTGQEPDTHARFDELLAWTAERFPVASVEHKWSGQIIEPVDGLPYIGRNSFSEHVWEATGYSGNGMTFGTLAGLLLADRILGRVTNAAWDELFDATRITPLASGWTYVEENVDFPVRFIGDRLKREPTQLSELARGDGSLFTIAGRKVAVHRDVTGELHALSPVCTHLRCLVEFNRAEKTWDCPCHGSRFDATGEVLNGPATRPLDKIRLVSQAEQLRRNLPPR